MKDLQYASSIVQLLQNKPPRILCCLSHGISLTAGHIIEPIQ